LPGSFEIIEKRKTLLILTQYRQQGFDNAFFEVQQKR